MICKDTIDEDMKEILSEKQKVADIIVDGGVINNERGKSYFTDFVKRLSVKHGEDFTL